jgi:hypothetical protein
MDAYEQLESLLDLAEQLGLKIRRLPGLAGEGDHPGGALTRVKGEEVLFLDAQAGLADQLSVTAAALAGRPGIEDRYMAPELREIIDRAGAR